MFNIAAVAAGAGYLLLAALIWYGGPLVGLAGAWSRVFGIGILGVVGGAALIARRILARRSGGLVGRMLQRRIDEAVIDARAERRGEVTALRQGLLSAIATLRQSRLGDAGGSAALYELPWYMVIGHPAAGKSSAVLNSGLTFPLGDKHAVQGVGGTRHCDWFFAAEGVLLDTAGRYATQSEDRAEWLAFLKLLKRHRSRAPVNGILVAVSLTELADWRSAHFAAYARQIRERIHEIDAAFGLQVPIYLVVTKLDLLAGFAQFFSHLAPAERARVWGATLDHDQGGGYDAVRLVGEHFDALREGLREMSEERLATGRGRRGDAALFAFPIEFNTLRDALCRFVELLHEDDPYHTRPLLRGFYLTSALQQGGPKIASAGRVSEHFGLAGGRLDNGQSSVSYSYFLRDLFREVLFPDQHLIAHQARPDRNRWRLAGLAGGLAMLAVLSAALTWAFVANQKLIDATREESVEAAQLIASAHLLDRLGGLVLLQRRLEEFQLYRERGHPWRLGIGLYRGAPLEAVLRKQYFAGLRTVMLAPVKASLEETLWGTDPTPRTARPRDDGPSARPAPPLASSGLPIIPLPGSAAAAPRVTPAALSAAGANEPLQPRPRGNVGNLEHSYNALKTYLMLHEQRRMEQAHLSDQLPRHWRPWLEQNRGAHDTEAVIALAERVAAFYIAQLGAPDLPLIDNEPQVIERARGVLRGSLQQMSATERVYNELKTRANTRFAPLFVSRILAGKDAGIVGGSVVVPGAFTREAWEQYLRGALHDASQGGIKSDDWVLAVAHEDSLGSGAVAEKNRLELEALYRDDFARAWIAFVQGVAVPEQGGLAETADALAQLADPQSSPIRLLLARIAHETSWDSGAAASASPEASPTGQDGGLAEPDRNLVPAPQPPKLGPLGREFEAVSAIAGEGDGGSMMAGYHEQLARVRGRLVAAAGHDEPGSVARQLMRSTLDGSGSELAQALQYVDGVMLASVSEASRRMLRPVLVRPLILAYGALIPLVEQDLNQAWQREIYTSWRTLADKYPFSDTEHDAALADIARFTRPDGTLARFVERHLDGLVVRRGEQLVPRTWGNQGLRFNASFLTGVGSLSVLGDKLSEDGADGQFELQPMPTPGLSEISVEIGGKMLRYRNGPQPWQEFKWPGEDDRRGARIQVVDFDGAATVVANEVGRMGFLRLLADASRQELGDGTAQLAWRVDGERSDRTVKLRFRHLGGVSPLQLSDLRRVSLPERISR